MASKAKRPTTCGALALVDPTLGEAGCKRLPRHHGEHRATLHMARQARESGNSKATTGRRVSKAGLKRLQANLAAAVEAGNVTPSVAMSRIAAYVTRLQSQRARRVAAAQAEAVPA